MKEIKLTQGKVALVDDEDYADLSQFKWHAVKFRGSHTLYAARRVFIGKKWGRTLMHRFILGLGGKDWIDHKNGDGLDNQRHNLRICTNSQNQMNQALRVDNTSGFRGICRSGKKWSAAIRSGGEKIHLGTFETKEVAALARDHAAIKYHGEFARLNFPSDPRKE
jgi:hypothetical protein